MARAFLNHYSFERREQRGPSRRWSPDIYCDELHNLDKIFSAFNGLAAVAMSFLTRVGSSSRKTQGICHANSRHCRALYILDSHGISRLSTGRFTVGRRIRVSRNCYERIQGWCRQANREGQRTKERLITALRGPQQLKRFTEKMRQIAGSLVRR